MTLEIWIDILYSDILSMFKNGWYVHHEWSCNIAALGWVDVFQWALGVQDCIQWVEFRSIDSMNCSFQFQCRWTVSDLWVQDALERLDCVKVPSHAQPLVRWKQALKDQTLWPKAFSLFELQQWWNKHPKLDPCDLRTGGMQALQADHAVTGRSCTTFQFDSMKLFEQCSEPPCRGQYYLFFFPGWSQPTLGNLIDQRNQPV